MGQNYRECFAELFVRTECSICGSEQEDKKKKHLENNNSIYILFLNSLPGGKKRLEGNIFKIIPLGFITLFVFFSLFCLFQIPSHEQVLLKLLIYLIKFNKYLFKNQGTW